MCKLLPPLSELGVAPYEWNSGCLKLQSGLVQRLHSSLDITQVGNWFLVQRLHTVRNVGVSYFRAAVQQLCLQLFSVLHQTSDSCFRQILSNSTI